jgi:hypothetical protein
MKVGDLVTMVERYALEDDGCRTVGGVPTDLGIVVDIRKQAYKAYPDVHVLWSDGMRGYSSFQLELVPGAYVEVVR